MDIVCDVCGKRYVVSDEKIPPGGAVAVQCKGCGHKMVIRRPEGSPPAEEARSSGGSRARRRAMDELIGSQAREMAMEFFRPGAKTALWFCPPGKAATEIQRQLEQLGFEAREVKDHHELAARLRYHTYDLILLYQDSHEVDEPLRNILAFVNAMPLEERRRVFVALIFLGGNRVDEMLAFDRGVDLTLNPIDLARLREIIPYEMERKRAFYKRFEEIQEKVSREKAF